MKPLSSGQRVFVFLVIVVFLVVGMVLVWKQLPVPQAPAPRPAPTITVPTAPEPVVPTPAPAPEPIPPAVSTSTISRLRPIGSICDDTNSICVDASYQNTLLASPFVVTGTAIAFEQQFAWRLEDASGTMLEEGTTMTSATDVGIPGPFSIRSFILSVPETATGTLVLFERSAKDGSPIDVLRIQVRLPPPATVKLVLPIDLNAWRAAYNGAEDTRSSIPFHTVATSTARTVLPMEATLRKLLLWISWNMPSAGPPQVELTAFTLVNGTAYVSLNYDQDGWAGVSIYDGQVSPIIEKTLLQFPSVKRVVRGLAP